MDYMEAALLPDERTDFVLYEYTWTWLGMPETGQSVTR